VAFTGSTEVGRLIMESAARSNLKTVSLELGGKSPLIIFDDADVDMAVNLSRLAVFFNKVCWHCIQHCTGTNGDDAWNMQIFQGEVCVAGSRVYVQEGIYDEFVKKAVEAARSWKVGDPFDVTSNMGPQVQYIELLCVTDKLVKFIHGGSI
jgi:coniferyl-aldehyde dehydrogenase